MLGMVGFTQDNSMLNPGQCLDGGEAMTSISRALLPFTVIPKRRQVCPRQLVNRSIFGFLLESKITLVLVVAI